MKKKLGFTLLEMLVVIGIIAVLVSMGFVSYSTAQKKARDAKRKLELGSIKIAMEQYYSLCNGSYPTSDLGKVPLSIQAVNPPCNTNEDIMLTVPQDPKTADRYDFNDTGPPPSICAQNGPGVNLMESETAIYCVFLQQ